MTDDAELIEAIAARNRVRLQRTNEIGAEMARIEARLSVIHEEQRKMRAGAEEDQRLLAALEARLS